MSLTSKNDFRREFAKMSVVQNFLIMLSIIALIIMFVLLLSLSWGISFQVVAVGGVTSFVVAVGSTIIALCIGVLGIFSSK
ncbi:hypothetical protein FC80_GL000640 [Liquorilactobacillus cacaonum DSM 21116]|uniref:Uncharacterized protein n=2 Tax=Liquorilactobacillus cacaonum TaxID=483012 RepID=A0A0R2CH75_9LACO|nr:hypothetical protein FC80_GL000640 [Liquorilactobacillus cacaonum DSM 21116]